MCVEIAVNYSLTLKSHSNIPFLTLNLELTFFGGGGGGGGVSKKLINFYFIRLMVTSGIK